MYNMGRKNKKRKHCHPEASDHSNTSNESSQITISGIIGETNKVLYGNGCTDNGLLMNPIEASTPVPTDKGQNGASISAMNPIDASTPVPTDKGQKGASNCAISVMLWK